MNRKTICAYNLYLRACLMTALVTFAPHCQAGFFDKINEGIDKINQGIDSAKQAGNNDSSASDSQPKDKTKESRAAQLETESGSHDEATIPNLPDGVAYRINTTRGFRIKQPKDEKCYLAIQQILLGGAGLQNHTTFRNESGYENINYQNPIYRLLSYTPSLLKESSTNNLEKALYYFHLAQSKSEVGNGKEFSEAFLNIPFSILSAYEEVSQMTDTNKNQSVKMYKNLETGDTLETAKQKLESDSDIKGLESKGGKLVFQTEYLDAPANVTITFGNSGNILSILLAVALENSMGDVINQELAKSKEDKDFERYNESPLQASQRSQKRLDAYNQTQKIAQVGKAWEKAILEKYPNRTSQNGRIHYILPSEILNQKTQDAKRVESLNDIANLNAKMMALANEPPQILVVNVRENCELIQQSGIAQLKTLSDSLQAEAKKLEKSKNDF